MMKGKCMEQIKAIKIEIPLGEDDIYNFKEVVYRNEQITWTFQDSTEKYLVQVTFVPEEYSREEC